MTTNMKGEQVHKYATIFNIYMTNQLNANNQDILIIQLN